MVAGYTTPPVKGRLKKLPNDSFCGEFGLKKQRAQVEESPGGHQSAAIEPSKPMPSTNSLSHRGQSARSRLDEIVCLYETSHFDHIHTGRSMQDFSTSAISASGASGKNYLDCVIDT